MNRETPTVLGACLVISGVVSLPWLVLGVSAWVHSWSPDVGRAFSPPPALGVFLVSIGLAALAAPTYWYWPRTALDLARYLGTNPLKVVVKGFTFSFTLLAIALFLVWLWDGVFPSAVTAPQIVFALLLGSATLSGLLLAFARLEEQLRPAALSMEEALARGRIFLDRARRSGLSVAFCGYYPFFGVVAEKRLGRFYRDFAAGLKTYGMVAYGEDEPKLQLRVLCLWPGEHEFVEPARPLYQAQAVKSLAAAYHTNLEEAMSRLESEMSDLRKGASMDILGAGRTVPDYHFLIAGETASDPGRLFARIDRALLLLPVRPPGLGLPSLPEGSPPFVGIETVDSRLLAELERVYVDLRDPGTTAQSQVREDSVASPDPASATGDGPKV